MKKLIYEIKGYTDVYNPETGEVEQQLIPAKVVVDNPTDEDIARAAETACNGEYTIEDDGQPALVPTLEERVGDLEADTSDLAEALNMILEGVVE